MWASVLREVLKILMVILSKDFVPYVRNILTLMINFCTSLEGCMTKTMSHSRNNVLTVLYFGCVTESFILQVRVLLNNDHVALVER